MGCNTEVHNAAARLKVCIMSLTTGTDCMIHAYKLVTVEASSNNNTGGKGSTAQKKKQQPSPLPSLEVEVVPLFSVAHGRKVNALACVFAPYPADIRGDAASPVPASVEALTPIVAAVEITDNSGAAVATEDPAVLGTSGADNTAVPTASAANGSDGGLDTSTAKVGLCTCFVADTTNDITQYKYAF
jgi:hypothetical protein